MKAINGWDKVQGYTGGEAQERLPAGGYIGKIIGAKVASYEGANGTFDKLEIALDITEGEFKDFYKKQFEASTLENKKWKGVIRLNIPTEDGSEADAFRQRILKGATDAVEESNSGYHWDWDESKLKGKKIGFLVRDKQYDFNGKQGFFSEIFALISVEAVREHKYKDPAPKLLNNGSGSGSSGGTGAQDAASFSKSTNEEYPF